MNGKRSKSSLHWKYSNEDDSFDGVNDPLVEWLMLENCSVLFETELEDSMDTMFVSNRMKSVATKYHQQIRSNLQKNSADWYSLDLADIVD